VRTKVTGIADGAGEVSLSARPGAYILTTLSDEGPVAVQIAVPDQATATIGDCLAAVSEIVYTTAELAVLAASGLLTYATTVAGLAATPSGRFFMTPAAPSGLSVWENVAGVATLRGALLDEQDLLDAATAATAADRLQTGLDAAAAALSSSAAVAAETAASGARDAAVLSRGVFASTAAGLSQGVAAVTVTAGGASGANGVFALAFSGGAGTGAAGTFTVAGGAVVSVTITHPGSDYTSAPTVSFAASAGLTGATATVAIAPRSPVGTYFSVPAAGDESLILYRVDAGPVATEVTRYPATAAEARGRRTGLAPRRRGENRFQVPDLEARVAALENRIARAVQGAAIIYCDPTATGTGDGSSWTNACTTLPAAIAALSAGGILRTNSTEANPLAAPAGNVTSAPSNVLWETDQGAAGETWISGAQKGTWTDAGGGVFSIALAAEPRYVAYGFKRDDAVGAVTGVDLTHTRIARALREWGLAQADMVAWYGVLRRNSPLATATPAEGCWGYTGGVLYINPPGSPVLADVHSRAAWSDGRAGLAVTATITGWTITGKMTVIFTPSDNSGEGYSLRFTGASRCVVEGVRSILSGYHSVGFAGSSGARNVINRCVTLGYCPGGIPYVFYTDGPALPKSGHRLADSAVVAWGPLDTLGVPISLTHGARTAYSHTTSEMSGIDYNRLLQVDFTGQMETKHSVAFTLSPGFVSAGATGDVLDQAVEESFGIKVRNSVVLGKNARPETDISHVGCEFDRLG
jgi:hypothetical protein